jgi:hypothetical protein
VCAAVLMLAATGMFARASTHASAHAQRRYSQCANSLSHSAKQSTHYNGYLAERAHLERAATVARRRLQHVGLSRSMTSFLRSLSFVCAPLLLLVLFRSSSLPPTGLEPAVPAPLHPACFVLATIGAARAFARLAPFCVRFDLAHERSDGKTSESK